MEDGCTGRREEKVVGCVKSDQIIYNDVQASAVVHSCKCNVMLWMMMMMVWCSFNQKKKKRRKSSPIQLECNELWRICRRWNVFEEVGRRDI